MKNYNIPEYWTPVETITLTIKTRPNCLLKINSRKHYPLTLANALTVHKSQVQTLHKVVVHLKKKVSRELFYVACSRATTLNGPYIIGKFSAPTPFPKSSYLYSEKKRWRKCSIIPKFEFLQDTSNCLRIMYHKVQSLPKNIKIKNDKNFTSSDIIILGETWTKIKTICLSRNLI